jgi:hypothetical protein
MSFSKVMRWGLAVALCLLIAVPVNAQTAQRKKEITKVVKTLPEASQEAVFKFADAKLEGKEEGVSISDIKSLKKNFKLLPSTAQADLLSFAQRQAEAPAQSAVAVAPARPAQATQPARPPQPAQAGQLKPAQGTLTQTPAKPAQPAQPAYIEKANNMAKTSVQWYEEMHDFGQITQGDVATHVFKFKNVGENDLLLTRVKASCGCTTPEWSTEPIKPGEEGLIKVAFNSRGKMGNQMKSVSVTYNGEPIHKVLRFKGKIVAKPAAPAGN